MMKVAELTPATFLLPNSCLAHTFEVAVELLSRVAEPFV